MIAAVDVHYDDEAGTARAACITFADWTDGEPVDVFEALNREVEVVGVAKNAFRESPGVPVLRGRSARPLWVSSTGDGEQAAAWIAQMAGENRLPTLLKRVDHVCRGWG